MDLYLFPAFKRAAITRVHKKKDIIVWYLVVTYRLTGACSCTINPGLWLAVVPVILYDRPTPPFEGLSKPSPEPLLHVTASGISVQYP